MMQHNATYPRLKVLNEKTSLLIEIKTYSDFFQCTKLLNGKNDYSPSNGTALKDEHVYKT